MGNSCKSSIVHTVVHSLDTFKELEVWDKFACWFQVFSMKRKEPVNFFIPKLLSGMLL